MPLFLHYRPHSIDLNFLPLAVFSTFSFLTPVTFEQGSLWLSYAEELSAGKSIKRLARPATGVTQKMSDQWSVASSSIRQAEESINVFISSSNFSVF